MDQKNYTSQSSSSFEFQIPHPFGSQIPNPFGSQIPHTQLQNTNGQSNHLGRMPPPPGPPPSLYQDRFNYNNPFSNNPFQPNFNQLYPNNVGTFDDDEPILVPPSTTTLPNSGLENVTIETFTETLAMASSDSKSSFAVLVGIQAPSLPVFSHIEDHRVPIDLVVVLDVSGSMMGEKLSLLKYATKFVIDHMLPSDRLSIISFSTIATRILPLRRMTERGRKDAEFAVDLLRASGGTNIVSGLNMGASVLEKRRQFNPVSSIILLSDGQDTTNSQYGQFRNINKSPPGYLRLLSSSISNFNSETHNENGRRQRFPVYTFGVGMDHDAVAMNAIADGSCGTYSFVESAEMIPRSFARCIGGLFSVVAQDVQIMVSSASPGVEIVSIPSGRHKNEIISEHKQGKILVGDLFAEEKKEFLIYLKVPTYSYNRTETEVCKTPLLDIVCYYRNSFTEEIVQINSQSIEILRPITLSPAEKAVNLKVDGQRNRVAVAESISKAKEMADKGNLNGAKEVLNSSREKLVVSASAESGVELVNWLEAELKEMTARMENMNIYDREGRPFMLAGMSAHGAQRATSRNFTFLQSAGAAFGASGKDVMFAAAGSAGGAAYDTPLMAQMQNKVQKAPPPDPNQKLKYNGWGR